MRGRVFLIGAGPGDPELLTLRGAALLGQADVVLYDGLSNVELLRHAPSAEHICVGKHGQSRIWKQSEIIDEILCHARAGKAVARLKGGDPAVFARTAEEVDALRDAGIPVEIVPGITAALAAGSFAGIPITHRGVASAVALVTGHEEPEKSQSALDWRALAEFPGTLVVYMGVTTAGLWTKQLLEAGKPPDTPAAIVRRCSMPDQQTIRCRLDEVERCLTPPSKFRPPVIVILGAVAQLANVPGWQDTRPLRGQTILVTRPADQAESLAAPLRDLGAAVLVQPAIEIRPPETWSHVDRAIADLPRTDLLVFCSQNGVGFFLRRLCDQHGDVRMLAGTQIAVVGRKTAEALTEFGLRADLIPANFRAESLASELASTVAQKRVVIVRASRGRDVLADALSDAGAQVDQVIAYQHVDVTKPNEHVLALARDAGIDWVTITSSATAQSLFKIFGPSLREMKIASLSPVTSDTIRQLDLNVTAEADPFTTEALVEAIVSARRDRQP